MFAIIETGGKQYKVTVGETFNVEKLDLEVGSKIDLDVLMVVDGKKVTTGKPFVKSKATCEVVEQGKNAKVMVIRYKAKKNVHKRQGHRQPFTTLKLLEVK